MPRILCLALLALVLAACGSDEDAITEPAAPASSAELATSAAAESEPAAPVVLAPDALAGRSFVLEEAEVGGQPKELAVPIQISFEADRLSAQPGCNSASGGYTLEDNAIVLGGPLAQTMMACEDQALVDQDAWFASVLEARPTVSLDDGITLTTDDAVLRGRVVEAGGDATAPVTADDLAGRAFVLEEAEEGGAPKELAVPIQIAFEADRLNAQPGCNGASGGYTMEDGTLTLSGPLAQTMMMCADEALVQQDAWFATVLEASPRVALDGDAIVLTTDDATLRGRDRDVAMPDRPLEGTPWTITSRIDGAGADGAVSSELWMEQSQLTFEPGGRLQGSTECGGVVGAWTLDTTGQQLTITLEPHGPCTGDQGKLEEQTFSYLSGPLTVAIDADQATLTRPDGSGVVLKAAGESEASATSEPATTG